MIHIRRASVADAGRILEIYAYYVTDTAVTFEYEVPSLKDFENRIKTTLAKYPYLVLEEDGVIQGYAYAGTFKGRAAYDWSCELSIYLDKDKQGAGFGRRLYEALEEELKAMGITNSYACIAYPQVEDEYLTRKSPDFHAHLGFVTVGEFHQCAYKFGRWYNMIWMEKMIGEHREDQPPVFGE